MKLTQQALKELEVIWNEDHPGQQIAAEELEEIARRLLFAAQILVHKR